MSLHVKADELIAIQRALEDVGDQELVEFLGKAGNLEKVIVRFLRPREVSRTGHVKRPEGLTKNAANRLS